MDQTPEEDKSPLDIQGMFPGIYIPAFLEVYDGCMRSSKTDELRLRFAKCVHAGIGYQIFQPASNTRDEGDQLTSRAGLTFTAYKIQDPWEILTRLQPQTKVVGLDEAHFFPPSIEQVVERILHMDLNVVVAGLDMDSERRKFGSMDYFMREADIVHKLHAVCEDCRKRPAKYSFFKGGKEEQVVVGDDAYLVLCRPCYHQHTKD